MDVQIFPASAGLDKAANNSTYQGLPVTETITNGFFTVDQKWTVIHWNKAAEKLLRVQAKDIIGKNLWEAFAAIIPLNFYTVYQKAFLRDVPIHFKEYWAEMGSWFDVVTYYCNNTLSVSFKSSNDLQPVHPQVQLKILNELYRFVTEVTNDCLWEWDISNREIFWIDGGHKRVFGYHIENAIVPQHFWESCLHPDDRVRVLAKLYKIFASGTATAWEEEYRFKKTSGDYIYVHDRGHIIYGENRAARMIGATQDITDRKLTEIKLYEAERKLSLITRQTVNAVIITDAQEHITWVNDAFTRITGYEPREVIGRTAGNMLRGKETNPVTADYIDEKMKDLQPFDCEIINDARSGDQYRMHMQGQALLDKKGRCEGFFAIQTDITEKKILENKLAAERIIKQKEITAAVLTAQENERSEIGKELHDNVNQILGATKLYIEMAKAGDKKKDIYLDQACGHLLNVIEEIRKISKTLVPQGINLIGLGDSIKILVDDLSGIHPLKIKFKKDGIDDFGLDEKLQLNIFRIVQEQTNNILKHSGATRAAISLTKDKNNIILLVSDNGKGCDTSQRKEGVGIQSILSRTELYQGKLTILSEPGKGYKLKIVFPAKTPG